MQMRQLGTSDLKISPIIFGAWAIGGGGWEFGWGPQEDEDSIAAIHRVLELGERGLEALTVEDELRRLPPQGGQERLQRRIGVRQGDT